MIQPCRARASARSAAMLRPDLADGARDQQLVVGAQVGAPPDPGLGRACPKRAVGVEHHDRRAGQPVRAQLPAGGDQHRFADLVERDAVPSRQRLDRGDAGDDVVVDVDVGRDRVEDAQRAVVQRRVAPGQEGADAVGTQFGVDGRRPDPRSRRVPVGDRLPVVGLPVGATASGRAVRRSGSRARG